MIPNRPLTHDLFKNALETFDVVLTEIIINDLTEGIFYAKLVCEKDGVPVSYTHLTLPTSDLV